MPEKLVLPVRPIMAGLDFESFKARLLEHFGLGYIIADECVLEELRIIENL